MGDQGEAFLVPGEHQRNEVRVPSLEEFMAGLRRGGILTDVQEVKW